MDELFHRKEQPGTSQSVTNVIVMANDEAVRRMLTMAVQLEFSCEVIALGGGKNMVEAVRQRKPELVVLYGGSESRRALALASQLHRTAGLERLPIILTHALESPNEGLSRPWLVVLDTPFVLETFYATLAPWLGC